MNRLLLSLVGIIAFASCSSNSKRIPTAINFKDTTFEAIQTIAKNENKNIFVLFDASWCSNCQNLRKQTLSDTALAHYFNSEFINLEVDIDKESSKALMEKYRVKSYPTLLFLDANGSILHQTTGEKSKNELMNTVNSFGKTTMNLPINATVEKMPCCRH